MTELDALARPQVDTMELDGVVDRTVVDHPPAVAGDGWHVVVERVAEARSPGQLDGGPTAGSGQSSERVVDGGARKGRRWLGHQTYDVMVTTPNGSPRLSFSTLACPEWDPLEVVERAASMG